MDNKFKMADIINMAYIYIKGSSFIQNTWIQGILKEQAVLCAESDNDEKSILFLLSSFLQV